VPKENEYKSAVFARDAFKITSAARRRYIQTPLLV
jgi:hypothetical protein